MEFKEGVYKNIPFDDYLDIPYLSSSALKELRKTPAHCRDYIDNKRETKPVFALGTAIHLALLEPEKYKEKILVKELAWNTSDGKLEKADFEARQAEDNSLIVVNRKDYDGTEEIVNKIKAGSHEASLAFDSITDVELTIIWKDQETGIMCKCRIDAYCKSIRQSLDIKSCGSAAEWSFKNDMFKHAYYIQQSFYQRGLRTTDLGEDFCFLPVEKDPPYLSTTYEIGDVTMRAADILTESLIQKYASCLEKDSWEGYPSGNVIEFSDNQLEILEKQGVDNE